MEYLIQFILLVALPLTDPGMTPAQKPKPTPRDNVKIETQYDKAKNRTTVALSPLLILGKETDGLFLGAEFSFTGQKMEGAELPGKFLEPPVYVLLTSVAPSPRYAEKHAVIFRYDDQQRSVANPEFDSQVRDGLAVETVRVPFMRDYLYQVVNAQRVEVQFGAAKFELTRKQLEALRRLGRHLAQIGQWER